MATVWEKGRGGFLKSRYIFLDDEAVAAVRSWLSIHPGGKYLFPGAHGPMTRDGVYHVMTKLAAESDVTEHSNPHAYRHAWSIEALRNGADIPTVARVLGNTPQTVMLAYSRWVTNDIQERHQQFSWKTNKNGNDNDNDRNRNGHH
jgi:integrase